MFSLSVYKRDAEAARKVSPIPQGAIVPVVIRATGVRKSKAGNDVLGMRCEISGGPHQGRKVWPNLAATVNGGTRPNPKAVFDVRRILESNGVEVPAHVETPEGLLKLIDGRPALAKVKHEPNGRGGNRHGVACFLSPHDHRTRDEWVAYYGTDDSDANDVDESEPETQEQEEQDINGDPFEGFFGQTETAPKPVPEPETDGYDDEAAPEAEAEAALAKGGDY